MRILKLLFSDLQLKLNHLNMTIKPVWAPPKMPKWIAT